MGTLGTNEAEVLLPVNVLIPEVIRFVLSVDRNVGGWFGPVTEADEDGTNVIVDEVGPVLGLLVGGEGAESVPELTGKTRLEEQWFRWAGDKTYADTADKLGRVRVLVYQKIVCCIPHNICWSLQIGDVFWTF